MRDRDLMVVALAVVLAGCPLGTSTTTTTTLSADRTTSIAPAADPAGAASPAGAAPSAGGTPKATVPNLVGKTPEQAQALVKAAGFAHEPEASRPLECEGAPRDPGLINCQDPDAGAVIDRYRMITISVYREQVITGAIVRRQLETSTGSRPTRPSSSSRSSATTARSPSARSPTAAVATPTSRAADRTRSAARVANQVLAFTMI